MQIFLIGLGGAIGALLRFGMLQLFDTTGTLFPYPIFLCNVLGCLLFAFIMAKPFIQTSTIRLFVTTGILGAFTTFSTFSVETIQLLQQGHTTMALFYSISTLIVGLSLAIIGYRLGGGQLTRKLQS